LNDKAQHQAEFAEIKAGLAELERTIVMSGRCLD